MSYHLTENYCTKLKLPKCNYFSEAILRREFLIIYICQPDFTDDFL